MRPEIEMPARIKKLRTTGDGYPIPWFVGYVDGKPDFRLIHPDRIMEALRFRLCWICGEPLGTYKAFVVGPMCIVNHTSSEPPSHRDCGIFAAKACPFLSDPKRQRRTDNLPAGKKDPAGIHLDRNPGVAVVWVTKKVAAFKVDNGILFSFGPPEEIHYFAKGRPATRLEVLESINSGLPALQKYADAEGPEAMAELNARYNETLKFLPKL